MQEGPFQERGSGAARPFWERRDFLLALILVSALPLLWPDVPPLLDLPGHMGRYRVQLDLATAPDLQQYFGFQWAVIGNLGVDLLVQALAPLLGLETAVKLIVIAIPPLTVGGLLWVAYEVHGRIPPTRPVRGAVRVQFPLPVRLRQFRSGHGAGAERLRLLAAARPARPCLAARLPVPADLDAALGGPRLRLGDIGRARFLGRTGPPARPRPPLPRRRLPCRNPLPGAAAADRADAALAQRSRRARPPAGSTGRASSTG